MAATECVLNDQHWVRTTLHVDETHSHAAHAALYSANPQALR